MTLEEVKELVKLYRPKATILYVTGNYVVYDVTFEHEGDKISACVLVPISCICGDKYYPEMEAVELLRWFETFSVNQPIMDA